MLFLDYDGTLTGFQPDPQMAKPDNVLIGLLKKLTSNEKNKVVIISGRDRETLDKWLGHMPLDIIAEHGVWLKEHGKEWGTIRNLKSSWKNELRPTLDAYVNRTPVLSWKKRTTLSSGISERWKPAWVSSDPGN